MIEWAGVIYTFGKELYGYYKDGKEVYDAAKGGYDTVKEMKDHFEVKEGEPKLVDFKWPEKSGFSERAKGDGYTVSWVRADRIASLELDGYEVMYEVDKAAKVKRKLVLRDGLTLVGAKDKQ